MSSETAAHRAQDKKPYTPPQLTVFGPLSKLTQNGTGVTNESNGQKLCGSGYQASGTKSC